jgi:hypothetical protein
MKRFSQKNFHLRPKMFYSSESHASSSNIDCFTSISSDEEILEDMNEEDMAIFHCRLVVATFTLHEIEEGVGQSMDVKVGV